MLSVKCVADMQSAIEISIMAFNKIYYMTFDVI
jgi:hypothetical protein